MKSGNYEKYIDNKYYNIRTGEVCLNVEILVFYETFITIKHETKSVNIKKKNKTNFPIPSSTTKTTTKKII